MAGEFVRRTGDRWKQKHTEYNMWQRRRGNDIVRAVTLSNRHRMSQGVHAHLYYPHLGRFGLSPGSFRRGRSLPALRSFDGNMVGCHGKLPVLQTRAAALRVVAYAPSQTYLCPIQSRLRWRRDIQMLYNVPTGNKRRTTQDRKIVYLPVGAVNSCQKLGV